MFRLIGDPLFETSRSLDFITRILAAYQGNMNMFDFIKKSLTTYQGNINMLDFHRKILVAPRGNHIARFPQENACRPLRKSHRWISQKKNLPSPRGNNKAKFPEENPRRLSRQYLSNKLSS